MSITRHKATCAMLELSAFWWLGPEHKEVTDNWTPFDYVTVSFIYHSSRTANLPYKCNIIDNVKVPITLKYFFGLNKSLHLFETHCTFKTKS